MNFTERVIRVIQGIPVGKVMSYGGVAAAAGNPRGARQVVRILHSSSRKHGLPWHRVINSAGKISLPEGEGYEEQRALLEAEGIAFSESGRVHMHTYGHVPLKMDLEDQDPVAELGV